MREFIACPRGDRRNARSDRKSMGDRRKYCIQGMSHKLDVYVNLRNESFLVFPKK